MVGLWIGVFCWISEESTVFNVSVLFDYRIRVCVYVHYKRQDSTAFRDEVPLIDVVFLQFMRHP